MIIRQKQNRYPLLHAITVPAGLLLAVVFLAGCPASPPEAIVPPPPEPGVTDVSIRDFAFIPDEITIRAGESVRWINLEPTLIAHTSTSGDPGDDDTGVIWDSGLLVPGEFFTQRFINPGEFIYFCRPHAAIMRTARVIVVP